MAAIVKSPVAMAAMWRSDTAIKALQANATAWKTFTGASSAVMGKTVAILANLDPSGYADMTAVAASQVAMAAIIGNSTALNAVVTSQVAMTAIIGNSTALNAVVTSSVAMTAVAASQVAMAAIQKSQTALNAIAASSMATAKYAAGAAGLNPADYADMAAVASSQVAMAAVAASATARAAVCASDVAYNYLLSKATFDTISGQYTRSGWSTRYAKPCIVLKWCYSYNSGTSGIRTCLDGAASRQYTGTQRYNSSMGSNTYNDHAEKNGTYYKEFVFCSKLETYNSQSDWPAISIAYFPLP